jgi:hypothetical protein
MDLESIERKLTELDEIPKTSTSNLGGIRLLNEEETNLVLDDLHQRSLSFEKLLNKMIVPMRFAMLSLLSEGKVSIFNDSMMDLARMILDY